jgi:hypothetical protein
MVDLGLAIGIQEIRFVHPNFRNRVAVIEQVRIETLVTRD